MFLILFLKKRRLNCIKSHSAVVKKSVVVTWLGTWP